MKLGILSLMLAVGLVFLAQARADETSGEKVGDKVNNTAIEAKKTGRAVKRKAKKAGRQATGNDNVVDDTKDKIEQKSGDLKDDLNKK